MIDSSTRVSPSSQELKELLVHRGTRHHGDNHMNGKWIIIWVHEGIHNKVYDYNDGIDGGGVDDVDGDVDVFSSSPEDGVVV